MSGPVTARRWRILRALLIALLALLLTAFVTGWWLLAGSRARLDGTRQATALTAPVSIGRDALGTVTIEGKNRTDISYSLGYVHAQERFFAMDLMRRMPAGELSALVGPAALKVDLNHRRHRLRAVVEAAYAQLPPAQKHELDRYRDGVNAGLADLRVRPWEYLLLGSQPQPWRSEDCLLVIAAMYLDLNGDGRNERELHMAQMRATLPGPLVDFLLAPDPDWEAPLSGRLSRSPVIPAADVFDLRHRTPAASSTALAAALTPALDAPRPGSNNFAIGGALTSSGAAMLANDMHLGLRVPNIWFRTRLRYPDPTAPNGQRDVNGVSLPGTPAIIVGSNGQIAWGFTNSYGDWQDWVRVRRDSTAPTRYKVPDGWAAIESHAEHIRVKGRPDVILEVEDTRWGPIMGKDVDGTPLALAWIAGRPRSYNLALMQLEHASDVSGALNLAPQLGMPPQNLLVADSGGNIGWTLAGNSIPLRTSIDPLLPSDWSQSGNGWQGWASPTHYPRIENPADGRLWTANNRTVDGAALALLGNGGHDLGARAQQIRDDLHTRASFTPGNLLDIQMDDRAVFLTRWQRLLQDTLADSTDRSLQQLRRLIAQWQERAAVDSVDYRLVRTFRDHVGEAVLAPFAAQVQQRYPDFSWPGENSAEAAVWALVRARPAHLLDPKYPDWHALLTDAARQVVAELGRQPGGLAARNWGERNRAGIRHPLSAALPSWLGRFIDMPDQPIPGDNNMPHVASPGFGASEHLDVSPGHEAHGILNMPGGQSDHPLSPYFGAGHEDWVEGRPTPLLPGQTQHTLTLRPSMR
ncbi:penicillin acylase family protein [Rhodanobacter glycinis]|uniref:penicillin acylase family protein n=1 Tax=Rhodanobacter glycinis TaxID=582702 RepID=UPI00112C5AD9|nr:penicillin acylase family protein [Rhodanobacter glycinis]TPG45637.1 penicillin acylase family protein [Rhodanobacter glycinis]